MSRARTLAGAIGSDGALNVADVAGLAAVASSGSASDLSTGTLPNARLASGAAVANLGYTPVNKAGDTMTGSITKNLATGLGYTAGNYVVFDSLHQNSGSNEEYLTIMDYRNSNGSDWTTSGSRIQKKIDSTWMGYIEFNGGLSGGVSIGAGLATAGPNASGITRCLTVEGNGNVTVQNGNLVLTNGKGIDFSAGSNASGMTGELLDDYEHGTWTPSINLLGTLTYSNRFGKYQKIGKFVHVSLSFSVYSSDTTQDGSPMQITGLPFTSSSDGSNYANGAFLLATEAMRGAQVPTAQNTFFGLVDPGATTVSVVQNNYNATISGKSWYGGNRRDGYIGGTMYVLCQFRYEVA